MRDKVSAEKFYAGICFVYSGKKRRFPRKCRIRARRLTQLFGNAPGVLLTRGKKRCTLLSYLLNRPLIKL